jgi:superfamily II DNA or RNA helicase
MIRTRFITTEEDFKELKKGDLVAVEWKRDNYIGDKRTRFAVYTIYENKERTTEIILQRQNNVYFNYSMFLNPEIGISNCKSIMLLRSTRLI